MRDFNFLDLRFCRFKLHHGQMTDECPPPPADLALACVRALGGVDGQPELEG